jgi:pimeloyl-ACP methyl ester carboxylesterase
MKLDSFKIVTIFISLVLSSFSGISENNYFHEKITTDSIPLWETVPAIPKMPPADVSGLASVNGIKMYYAIYNKNGKDPVILIHGGLGSSDDWGFETPLLSKTNKVIVVDCRGRGRSTMTDEPLSYRLMTSDLVKLMDFLHIQKASVVGASDGGIIGLLLAIHYPERINKLLAYGANFNNSGLKPGPFDSISGSKYFAMISKRYKEISPTPNDFQKMTKALNKMYETQPNIPPRDLKTIQAPTIIADGEYEQFFTREHTEKLARLIPGAKLVIMPNVSHGGPIQDPQHFHELVMQLL